MSGLPGFLKMSWKTVGSGFLTDGDVGGWPCSVGTLVKFTAFLSTLRWPEEEREMGKYGVSYLEFLILFERWVGPRLLHEQRVPTCCRVGRSLSLHPC